MFKLFAHQQKIIDQDPEKYLLALSTGTGKTATALSLAKGKTLVIAPKTQVLDKNFERQLEKMDIPLDLTVISVD